MPRPLRVEIAGGVYHVIVRGNERKDVFRDDEDREAYLERLAACRERFGFFVYAYCLMDNHVHLAIERGAEPLSRIMLTLQSSYTQRFNKRHDRVGHLFQGRYKAFLVERDRYLLALLRYIHLNPVRAGITARPDAYRWSSDRFYRGARRPEWLDSDRVLRILAPRGSAARARYGRLMDGPAEPPYAEIAAFGGAIVGDEDYARQALRQAVASPGPKPSADVQFVARIVSSEENLSVEDLRRRGNAFGPALARAIAAYVGRRELEIPVSTTARYFGRDESTLVREALKVEAAQRRKASLKRRIDAIASKLRNERAKTHG